MRRELFFRLILVVAALVACRLHWLRLNGNPIFDDHLGTTSGYWNLSTYNQGMMGYRTPNIDSIGNEGTKFTDALCGEQLHSRAVSIHYRQIPSRTGLLKVGLPGAKEGLGDKDSTLAELLKPLGYTSGQFGKNHCARVRRG